MRSVQAGHWPRRQCRRPACVSGRYLAPGAQGPRPPTV